VIHVHFLSDVTAVLYKAQHFSVNHPSTSAA